MSLFFKDPPEETLIQELGSSEHSLVLVKPPYGSYAVVGIDRKGFVCHRCVAGRHSCLHINCLTDYLRIREGNLPDFLLDIVAARNLMKQSAITSRAPTSISRGRISWCTTQRQRKIYALSSSTLEYCLADGTMALSPSDDACSECGGDMTVIVEYPTSKKRLLLWADVIQVTGKFDVRSSTLVSQLSFLTFIYQPIFDVQTEFTLDVPFMTHSR